MGGLLCRGRDRELLLGRLTRSTATWPLAALLAAQPLPLLALTGDLLTGPGGAAVFLALAAADLAAARSLRRYLAPVARVLSGLSAALGVLVGLSAAHRPDPAESWTATAVLTVAGAAVLVLAGRWAPTDRLGSPSWSPAPSAPSWVAPWPGRCRP